MFMGWQEFKPQSIKSDEHQSDSKLSRFLCAVIIVIYMHVNDPIMRELNQEIER